MAVLWSLLILAYATLVGCALIATTRPKLDLAAILTAPALGFGVLVLALFALSYAEVPVGRSAVPVALLFGVAAVAVLVFRRASTTRGDAAIAAAICVLAYAIVGWPLLVFGDNWVAYLNGDQAFYSVSAANFQRFGLFDVPSVRTLVEHSQLYRNFASQYAYVGYRPGWELLLGSVATAMRVTTARAYMVVLMAIHAAMACAAVSLVARNRGAALFAGLFACVAPMIAYGTYLGLAPQQLGIAIACAFLTWCFTIDEPSIRRRLPVLAVASAALALAYPEIAPFVAVTIAVHALVQRRWPRAALAGGVVGLAALGPYLPVVINYGVDQIASAREVKAIGHTFAPILQPVGLANMWGLLTVAAVPDTSITQLAIASAIVATLGLFVLLAVRVCRGDVPATMAAVLIAVSSALVLRGADFGAFKALLYAVPFVAVTLGALAATRRLLRAAAIVGAVIVLPAQMAYAVDSVGDVGRTTYGSISGATTRGLLAGLESIRATASSTVLVDSPYTQLTDLASVTIPMSSIWPLDSPVRIARQEPPPTAWHPVFVDGAPISAARYKHDITKTRELSPELLEMRVGSVVDPFKIDRRPPSTRRSDTTLVTTSLTILNAGEDRRAIVTSMPLRSVRNHLVFVQSDRGVSGFNLRAPIAARSFYNIGADPLVRGAYFQPVGRYLLFQALEPTRRVAMRIELSSTLIGDARNQLPPARVTGRQTVSFPVLGRGAARVYSPPFEVRKLAGTDVVGLDLGAAPKPLPDRRTGLWALYGLDVPYDQRRIVTYARDISLVDADAQRPTAPAAAEIPASLRDVALVYSGIYDDGWIAERSYVVLRKPTDARALRVRLQVPQRAQTSGRCTISIDGRMVDVIDDAPGDDDQAIDVRWLPAGAHRIDIAFERAPPLGPRDLRPASALLLHVAFAER